MVMKVLQCLKLKMTSSQMAQKDRLLMRKMAQKEPVQMYQKYQKGRKKYEKIW